MAKAKVESCPHFPCAIPHFLPFPQTPHNRITESCGFTTALFPVDAMSESAIVGGASWLAFLPGKIVILKMTVNLLYAASANRANLIWKCAHSLLSGEFWNAIGLSNAQSKCQCQCQLGPDDNSPFDIRNGHWKPHFGLRTLVRPALECRTNKMQMAQGRKQKATHFPVEDMQNKKC